MSYCLNLQSSFEILHTCIQLKQYFVFNCLQQFCIESTWNSGLSRLEVKTTNFVIPSHLNLKGVYMSHWLDGWFLTGPCQNVCGANCCLNFLTDCDETWFTSCIGGWSVRIQWKWQLHKKPTKLNRALKHQRLWSKSQTGEKITLAAWNYSLKTGNDTCPTW